MITCYFTMSPNNIFCFHCFDLLAGIQYCALKWMFWVCDFVDAHIFSFPAQLDKLTDNMSVLAFYMDGNRPRLSCFTADNLTRTEHRLQDRLR